jgi:hypothetical protein
MAGNDKSSLSVLCHAIMNRNGFNYNRKREWIIWAAKHQQCPSCEQEPGNACLHLGELKTKAREHVKFNRMPHDPRIDWERLLEGLKKRGYK